MDNRTFRHFELSNITGKDPNKVEEEEKESVKKASSKTFEIPCEPHAGWFNSMKDRLLEKGYQIISPVKFILPELWRIETDKKDHRRLFHVDEKDNIQAVLFIKDNHYDRFVVFNFVSPYKFQKDENPLENYNEAIQKLNITIRTTYGHPQAQSYIDSAYEELVQEYNKVSGLFKFTLPEKPVVGKSFF